MAKSINLVVTVVLLLILCWISGCQTKTSPQTGTLEISSSPPVAQVYLDSQYKGTTPLTITDVSAGSHVVEVRLTGYYVWTTSGTMEAGQTVTVQAILDPLVPPTPVPVQVTTTRVPTPVSTPAIGVVEKLDLLDYSSYSTFDYLQIVGEVKNSGTTNLKNVKIVASFYDATDDLINTYTDLVFVDILRPNQKSPFHLLVKPELATGHAYFKLTTNMEATTQEPYSGLTIRNPSARTSGGIYMVTGGLRNNGNRKIESYEVMGTFYDSSDKVVDTRSETHYRSFAPGDIDTFGLYTYYPDPTRIKSYELQVEEDLSF